MSNETAKSQWDMTKFADNLYFLFLDCWSGDPGRALFCQASTAFGVITGVVLPIFMAVGFFGNSITAYIYLWKKRPITRQAVFFAAISLSDNFCLFVTGFMWMFLAKGLPWISGAQLGFFTVNQSETACRVVRYLESFSSLASSSLFLLMVVDRCLSVYFPFRFQRLSAKAALRACAAALVVDAVLTVPVAVYFRWIKVGGDYTTCLFSQDTTDFWGIYALMLLLHSPPSLIYLGVFLTNAFLIHKMRQVAADQAALRAESRSGDTNLTSTIMCVALSVLLNLCSTVTVVAGIATFIINYFAISVAPSVTWFIWNAFDLGRNLILFNQSLNWFIFLWKSAAYRRHFLGLFACCGADCRENQPSTSNTPVQPAL